MTFLGQGTLDLDGPIEDPLCERNSLVRKETARANPLVFLVVARTVQDFQIHDRAGGNDSRLDEGRQSRTHRLGRHAREGTLVRPGIDARPPGPRHDVVVVQVHTVHRAQGFDLLTPSTLTKDLSKGFVHSLLERGRPERAAYLLEQFLVDFDGRLPRRHMSISACTRIYVSSPRRGISWWVGLYVNSWAASPPQSRDEARSMTDAGGLRIRPMTRAETAELVAWGGAEGWNPGLHDAELFWATDPEAFVAAERAGELIGGGAITAYGNAFGFMGLFIVRPEFRGRGFGNVLWHARLERLRARLRPGATIGMDGVFDMQSYYAKGGFVFSHRTIRHRAETAERASPPADEEGDVAPLSDVAFDEVLAYDRACFPAPRPTFLRAWIAPARRARSGLPARRAAVRLRRGAALR